MPPVGEKKKKIKTWKISPCLDGWTELCSWNLKFPQANINQISNTKANMKISSCVDTKLIAADDTDSVTQRTWVSWICLATHSEGITSKCKDPDVTWTEIRHRSVTVCHYLWLVLADQSQRFLQLVSFPFFQLRCHKSRCVFTNYRRIYIWILAVVKGPVMYSLPMCDQLSDLNGEPTGIVNKAERLCQYTLTFIVPFIWALATLLTNPSINTEA